MSDVATMRAFSVKFVLASLVGTLPVAPIAAAGGPYDRRTAIVEAIARTKDAIVNLRTMRNVPARIEGESEGRVRGLGTGVLIDPRGYVVTNHHVVEKVNTTTVQLADGREYPAQVLRNDDRADLAVLRIEADRELPFLPLWGAGPPILGETVIAIGNPYGLENSVTTGIISAIGRELVLPNGEKFTDLIQTDASINPGNSGGPLLNINGELLGINVAIRSNAQGIGFTIPTERVRRIVEHLMSDHASSIVQHGLYVEEVRMPVNGSGGTESIVRVAQVQSDSEAFKQGFRPGDELLRIARQQVKLRFDIERIFWDREPSEPLDVQVKRAGRMVDLKLLLKRPAESGSLWQLLGIMVEKVPAERVRPAYDALNGGLLLLKVAPGSPAAGAGFRPGDILIGLHEYETIETGNVRYIMQLPELSQIQPVEYHLIRDGRIVRGRFVLPAQKPSTAAKAAQPDRSTGKN